MLRCNNVCHLYAGYQKGFYRYMVNGNKACITCGYQIKTENIRCPCCRQAYRTKKHYFATATKREEMRVKIRIP